MRRAFAAKDFASSPPSIRSCRPRPRPRFRERSPVWKRRNGAREARLQGALAVTATGTGEVLALVGSRTPSDFGFNRALDAIRPVGSLAKPAVYLAALAHPERYTLASPVSDAPVRIEDEADGDWVPRNYDGRSHGRIPLYEALARSYNQATVRIGMDVGVDEVADYLHRLGVRRRLDTYPAMMLGAFDLSPIEVAQMYHTLASGGFRVPLRSIREVTDARGRKLSRYGVSVTLGVAPELNFLMVNALEAVMREGTGRAASRRLPPEFVSAGKTGTTDDLRDSWFAGFAGDRLAVVWLGHDDNSPAGLTGASGALSVWTDLMLRLKPASLDASPPPGVEWHWVESRLRPSYPARLSRRSQAAIRCRLRAHPRRMPGEGRRIRRFQGLRRRG